MNRTQELPLMDFAHAQPSNECAMRLPNRELRRIPSRWQWLSLALSCGRHIRAPCDAKDTHPFLFLELQHSHSMPWCFAADLRPAAQRPSAGNVVDASQTMNFQSCDCDLRISIDLTVCLTFKKQIFVPSRFSPDRLPLRLSSWFKRQAVALVEVSGREPHPTFVEVTYVSIFNATATGSRRRATPPHRIQQLQHA